MLVLAGVFFPGVAAGGSPVLDLASVPATVSMRGHVDVLLDESFEMTLGQVKSADEQFVVVGDRDYARPSSQAAVWVRTQVRNGGDVELERLLVVNFRLIDSVTAFLPDGEGGVHRHSAGEDSDLRDRLVAHPLPMFPVRLAPGQEQTIYLRLVDEGALPVPLKLSTWTELNAAESRRDVINGAFMGTLVLLLVYAIYLAGMFRQALYGWFLIYLVSIFVCTIFYFWGGAGIYLPADVRPSVVNRIIVLAAILIFWASTRFACQLMDLHEHFPRLDRWLRRSHVFYGVALLLAILCPFDIAILLSALCMVPAWIPVAVSVPRALSGDRIAVMYGASWVVLFVAVGVVYLAAFAIVPTVFSEFSVYVGLEIQFGVFCAAMAQKVKQIEEERRRAMEAELAAYARNAALSKSFERFVPKAFLDRLDRQSITDIELGQCVEKRMTTLFSDIRSFTSLVEKMTPEDNFAFINEYLGFMEPAIHQQLGFIDKYIGDAVMALFDVDDGGEGAGGALQAVRAAVGMHQALDHYNTIRCDRGEQAVAIGVGLHTGTLMLGTIGGRDRLNASVIGDAVNLASRVEGMTKAFGARTLLTDDTVDCLPPDHGFSIRVVGRVRVKGKEEPTTIFELLDSDTSDQRAMKEALRVDYQRAWEAFCRGDLETASTGFEELLKAHPDDKAAAVHLDICSRLQREGVPAAWDGVVTMETK